MVRFNIRAQGMVRFNIKFWPDDKIKQYYTLKNGNL